MLRSESNNNTRQTFMTIFSQVDKIQNKKQLFIKLIDSIFTCLTEPLSYTVCNQYLRIMLSTLFGQQDSVYW